MHSQSYRLTNDLYYYMHVRLLEETLQQLCSLIGNEIDKL